MSGKLEDLVAEKGSSAWLTVLPLQDLGFNLNKREFRDAVKLRYDWPVEEYYYYAKMVRFLLSPKITLRKEKTRKNSESKESNIRLK